MEFWTYYRLLRSRIRTIAVVAALILVVGVVAALPRQQEYAATVTLTTSPPDESRFVLVLVTDVAQARPDATRALAIELIRSRTVAERVAQRLNLNMTPGALRSKLRITRGDGDLINLSIRDGDAARAVLIANTYAEVAVAYNQEVNRREVALAREFIERELEDTRTRLTRAETTLDEFKRQQGIVSLDAQINAEVGRYMSLVSQQRALELDQREVDARIDALRSRLNQFQPTKTDQQVTENPVAQRLRGELINLEVQLAIARTTLTDQHPTVITLNQRIGALRDLLEKEVKRVVSTEFVQVNPIYENLVRSLVELETQRIAGQAKSAALAKVIPAEQKKLPGLNDIEREYARLSREVQVYEAAYTNLQGRLNDIRIREQAAMNRNLVYIVDLAAGAQPTAQTQTFQRIILAALLGLAGGVGVVLFQHYIDTTLKSAKEAEGLLQLPVLSIIPRQDPPFTEAYRLLKTNLGLHIANGAARVLMFTSARAGSGTSTVVFNLAQSIARGGKRVVVIDTDLRHPIAHRLFGVEPEFSLEDVVIGAVDMHRALKPTAIDNVLLLPAGGSTAELADLFASPEMAKLLEGLRREADVILMDAPPAVPFAEVRALASMVDGVVYVIPAGQVRKDAVEEVKRQLERSHARLIGVVINKSVPEWDDGYHDYERYIRPKTEQKITPAATALIIVALVGATSGALFRAKDAIPGWWVQGTSYVRSVIAERLLSERF
jgi:capsular exopolysaccharide synthesis family protein